MSFAKLSQFIPLQNVVYFITLPFVVRKIFTFYINYVLLLKCPFPGPKDECTEIFIDQSALQVSFTRKKWACWWSGNILFSMKKVKIHYKSCKRYIMKPPIPPKPKSVIATAIQEI